MKNLYPNQGCSLAFYQKTVKNRKPRNHSEVYFERMKGYEKHLTPCFENYNLHFDNNSLCTIDSSKVTKKQTKDDLINLYSFEAKVFRQLYTELTTDPMGRIIDTCQYCSLQPSSSLDHFIPKSEFPEYSVTPKNLIPCCSVCNGKKSNTWRIHKSPLFLNLYTDLLPETQFLFVKIDNNSDFKTTFYIENRNNIEPNFFKTIKSHFERLELASRYNTAKDRLISDLQSEIRAYLNHESTSLNYTIISEVIHERIAVQRKYYGHNHWKLVLQEELLKNSQFKNLFRANS